MYVIPRAHKILIIFLAINNIALQTITATDVSQLSIGQHISHLETMKDILSLIPILNMVPDPGNIPTAYTLAAAKICTWAYWPHVATGSIIAAGGGYYWYHKHSKQIDYTPNYDPEDRCEIPGMIGTCPPDVGTIIKQMKEGSKKLKNGLLLYEKTNYENTLLLDGPTGIGKTTLAEAIAKNTNSNYHRILMSNTANRYIGGSKDTLIIEIKTAIAQAEALDRCVVICVDEIDGMVSSDQDSSHPEYQSVYMALWDFIDTYKRSPRVFFVFITNNLDKLPAPLKDRLRSCTIHMKNPDAEQRKEFIYFFSKGILGKNLTEYCTNDCIETIIRETKNFSIRNIEGIFLSAQKKLLRKNEQLAQNHLLYGLDIVKEEVKRQNTPSKAERERQEAIVREQENLWWNRINGLLNIINLISKLPLPEN